MADKSTVSVELSQDHHNTLQRLARERGLSVDEFIDHLLSEHERLRRDAQRVKEADEAAEAAGKDSTSWKRPPDTWLGHG